MKKVSTTVTYGVLILAAAVMCFPVLFSLALSFSDLNDILAGDYIPDSLNFTNYINAIMMATKKIPREVLEIPNFQTIRSWDMLNTYQGLILPGLASTFGIFLFRQNMLQIPLELKEASTVAGVSEFGFFWKIVAPMVVNTVVTLAIYFFLVSWNSYMWPLLSTTEDTVRTVQIGLRQLQNTEAVSDYGMMAAGAMVTSLPTLLLIFFGQKRLQEGMTKGAIK